MPDWLAAQPAEPWATAALPDLSAEPSWGQPAEPSWGNFELEPEPASPFAAPAVPAAQEPFDHEPSFSLEPDPGFQVEAEPVFSLEADEPSFGVREDVFGAPSELSLDETPQDRYIEEPAAEEPAVAAAGFNCGARSLNQSRSGSRRRPPRLGARGPRAPGSSLSSRGASRSRSPRSRRSPSPPPPEPEPAFPPGPTVHEEPAPVYAAARLPMRGTATDGSRTTTSTASPAGWWSCSATGPSGTWPGR